MNFEYVLTYVCCALLVGLGGWVFHHTVDRRSHLNGAHPVTEELFTARLQALEDRLGGRIASVKVKLEDLEKCTQHLQRRLEKFCDR